MDTPADTPARTTADIAADTRDLLDKASKFAVPANLLRLAELSAEFQAAAAAELAELRDKLAAAEQELAAIHAAA